MVRRIKVGIIGTGSMATVHINSLQRVKYVEVIGIAGKTEGKAEHLCHKYKVDSYYTDYRELLSRPELDAVCIATPTDTHCQITMDSFEHGLHVFCEKPISLTVEEAVKMISAQEKAKRIFMVGYVLRFFEEYRRAKLLIEGSEIGDVRVAWFRKSGSLPQSDWYLDANRSGGVIFELGTHALDWLRWIVGAEVDTVSAEICGDIYNLHKEDNAWILLRFRNGAIGIVGSTYSFCALPNDVGIIGTKKSIGFNNGHLRTEEHGGSHSLIDRIRNRFSMIIPHLPTNNPYALEMEHFMDCIRRETRPIVTGWDGLKSLEIAKAAMESSNTKQKVRIE
ncbi:Gfo/Idh/MocA family protein [Chloroflexota bacterium]